MAGTLYLVSTPIGNLEDITFRAVRVLKEVGLIACEDTRQTRKLLNHYGISTPTISYHEHSETQRAEALLRKLDGGLSVALVSDSGTPLVSDPGYRLVVRALEAGVRVEPVPGPSATLAALAASGLPSDAFHFVGFLPAKSARRQRALEGLRDLKSTLIFYEAPHRILETLEDIESALGNRPAALAREITKLHEEFLRGTPAEIAGVLRKRPSIKGEITLLVGKAPQPSEEGIPVAEAVAECEAAGLSRMEAIKAVAKRRGLSKREVYKAVEGRCVPQFRAR